MSDITDDVGRGSVDPELPQFSEVYSRSFEEPRETTGPTENPRLVVVQLRHSWPFKMFLPLIIVLLGAGFFLGRVTSRNLNQGPSTSGDTRSKKPHSPADSEETTLALTITPPPPSAAATARKEDKPDAPRATDGPEQLVGIPHADEAAKKRFAEQEIITEREEEKVGEVDRMVAKSNVPKSGAMGGPAPDQINEIRREAEKEEARIAEMERMMEEIRSEAEEERKDEALERRLLQSRGNRPLEMDRIYTIHLSLLHREMEREIRNLRLAPLGNQVAALRPGTVWKGERTYQKGGYAGVTVPYEIHVDERSGRQFKGRKFDNGPGRNLAEVNGWIVGERISWVERAGHSVLTMRGTIKENVIAITFRGVYNNGVTNVGDGNLSRGRKPRSIAIRAKNLEEAASEISEELAIMRNPPGPPTPEHLRGRRGLIENSNDAIPDHAVHAEFMTAFEALEETTSKLRQGAPLDGAYDTLIRQLDTVIEKLDDMLKAAPNRDIPIDDLRSRFEEILKNVRRIERPNSQLERSGFEFYQQGILFSERGQLAAAKERFKQALDVLRQRYPTQSHPSFVSVLSEMGKVLRHQGQYSQALEFHRQAMEMHKRLFGRQDHPGMITILINIGEVLNKQGAHAQALNYYRQALEMNIRLYSKPDEPVRAIILNNIGGALYIQGEYAQALDYSRRALEMNERLYPNQDHLAVATSFNNVGLMLHILGHYDSASDYYQRALSIKRRLYSFKDHPSIAISLNNLGFAHWHRDQAERALEYHQQALAMRRRLYAHQDHPEIANSLDNVAFGHSKSGQDSQALDDSLKAFEMRKRLYPRQQYRDGHREILSSLFLSGLLLHFQGKDDQALPFVQDAVAMHGALSANFSPVASEAESLNYLGHLSPFSKDLLISISRNNHDTQKSLYSSVWNCKAMVLRMVQQRQQALIREGDPATQAINRDLLTVRHQLAGMLLAPAGSSENLAEQVHQLTERKEQLERLLEDRLPELRRKVGMASRPTSDLSACLPKRMVFIDIIQYLDVQKDPKEPGGKESRIPSFIGFVVRPGREAVPVFLGPSKPIEEAVVGWRHIIMDEKRSDADAAAFRTTLRSLVWEKLELLFPPETSTVMISPDSILTQLPWVALPGRDSDKVLLEDYALAIVPSGLFLLDELSSKREADKMTDELLCVGDVDYGEATATPTSPPAGRPVVWSRLKATKDELETIATLAGTRFVAPLTQGKASTTALLVALPKARWAHLATHGFFADRVFRSNSQMDESQFHHIDASYERFASGSRSPMALSGLVFAGANLPRPTDFFGVPQSDGGVLTAEAIAGLSLQHLELVVLSACETGLGEVTRNEGVFGLQRAFHTAGVHNVVASLWKVKSRATSELMKRFYHKLWIDSKAPIDALREAQLELYRHPELMLESDPNRGPDLTKTEKIKEITDKSMSSGYPRMRLWAGFILSGVGQ